MKKEDAVIIKKMVKYCDDVDALMVRFDKNFELIKAFRGVQSEE